MEKDFLAGVNIGDFEDYSVGAFEIKPNEYSLRGIEINGWI